jgi:hypothetical protein
VYVNRNGIMIRPHNKKKSPFIFQFNNLGSTAYSYQLLFRNWAHNSQQPLFLRALRDTMLQDYAYDMRLYVDCATTKPRFPLNKAAATATIKEMTTFLAQQERVFDTKNCIEQITQLYLALCVVCKR